MKLTKLKNMYILAMIVIAILIQTSLTNAQMHEVNYTDSIVKTVGPAFIVKMLKYEPYPVNIGDWFDVWIKVQNNGQNDAPDARFELALDYPFSAIGSTVRDYGQIYGTANAYKVDQKSNANQVILKYRIKTADNAPVGESMLKLKATADKDQEGYFLYSLPIEIGKTKTDFDVVMQDSTTQGVAFAIANTGDNDATGVIISVDSQKPANQTSAQGPANFTRKPGHGSAAAPAKLVAINAQSSMIGNLAKGDFTTVTFQVLQDPSIHELKMNIAYTDASGIRNKIEKVVPITISANANLGLQNQSSSSQSNTSKYIYAIVGLVLGLLVSWIYKKMRRKKI